VGTWAALTTTTASTEIAAKTGKQEWGDVSFLLKVALGARARWYRALADALHAEALAVRDGVAFCGRWRTYNLRVETDSQMLVNLWKKRKNHRAEIIPILHEIEEISKVFSSFEISYVPKNANLAAHYCAKEASPCNPECMWIGREPTSVKSVIQLECNPT
jgi:hypothetical protein